MNPYLDVDERSIEGFRAAIERWIATNRPDATSSDLSNLYSTSYAAFSAMNYRAENIALVKYLLVDDNNEVVNDKWGISKALSRNFDDTQLRTELTMCAWGENLLYKQIGFGRRVDEIRWINPNIYELDSNPVDGLKGFNVYDTQSGNRVRYIPRELAVYFHTVDFDDDLHGTAPIEVAFLEAGLGVEIATTALSFFRNMAIPAAVVQPAEGSKPPVGAKDDLVEFLRRIVQGAKNAGKTIVTPNRWEWLRLQSRFDEAGLPELSELARNAVYTALHVPIELLFPSASGYAQAFESRRAWLETWLVPRAEWYASQYTLQIAHDFSENWRVVPDFSKVPGLQENISTRTVTVNNQVTGSLMLINEGRKKLDLPELPELDNLIMVQGVPVPLSAVSTLYQSQFQPREFSKNPEAIQTPSQAQLPDQPPRRNWIPDDLYKELKNWELIVQRKGVDYSFSEHHTPVEIASYVRMELVSGATPKDAFEAAKRLYCREVKAYDSTESSYRSTLYDLISLAFKNQITRGEIGDKGRVEITTAFNSVYREGLKAGGVDLDTSDDLDPDEQIELNSEIKAERSYWTSLCNELFKEVLPMHGIYLREKESGNFDKANELYIQYLAKREEFFNRIEMYVTKGLLRIYNEGKLAAKANQMMIWEYGGTEEHCRSCKAAQGQIHRAKDWKRAGVKPQSTRLDCHGFKCECQLVPTTQKATGKLTRIFLHEVSDAD